jgi:hypothetical protein
VDIQLKQARKIVRNSDDLDTLDTKAQTQIGVALLDVVRETGPFFVEYTHREGNKTARCIGVTPHLGALIERTVSKFEELYTSYMPTLVPPRAWSTQREPHRPHQCATPCACDERFAVDTLRDQP